MPDLTCLEEEISRLNFELQAAIAAQEDAETALARLKNNSWNDWSQLKGEVRLLTLQLAEEREKLKPVDSKDILGQKSQIAWLKSIISNLEARYEAHDEIVTEEEISMEVPNRSRKREHELLRQVASLQDGYDKQKDGEIVTCLQENGILWGLSKKGKWFRLSVDLPDLPQTINSKLEEALAENQTLASRIRELNESIADNQRST